MANWAIADVSEKDNGEEKLLKKERSAQTKNQTDEAANFGFCLPIDVFETRIGNVADHQISNREHEWRYE